MRRRAQEALKSGVSLAKMPLDTDYSAHADFLASAPHRFVPYPKGTTLYPWYSTVL